MHMPPGFNTLYISANMSSGFSRYWTLTQQVTALKEQSAAAQP